MFYNVEIAWPRDIDVKVLLAIILTTVSPPVIIFAITLFLFICFCVPLDGEVFDSGNFFNF